MGTGAPDLPERPASEVGLCFTCRWMRATLTRRGSTFFRCTRADVDARFVRYPPLPVRSCPGYETTMLFFVLLHYTKPITAVDAVRPRHLEHVARHARTGVFHAWARRDPPSGGVLLAGAPDRATLEAIIAQDPYVLENVATAEIVEIPPANVRGVLRS